MRWPAAHYIPALLIACAVLFGAIYADRQRASIALENQRGDVSEQLGLMRSDLEGRINGAIQLGKGLVAAMSLEPDMDQARFSALASRVFEDENTYISIAAAPDMVVRMVHPYERNRKVVGFDYRRNPLQRGAAFWVAQARKVGVTGPVNLIQGGQGVIVRYPVLIDNDGKRPKLWGIVSFVMDMQSLYAGSGLLADNLDLDIALARGDRSGHFSTPFYGREGVLTDTPVRMMINFGHETWLMAAVPKKGWLSAAPDALRFRLLMLAGGLFVVAPLVWAGRLTSERQRNIQALEERGEQLKALSHRLEIALEASSIGIWEYDPQSGVLVWDNRMRELYGVRPEEAGLEYEHWRRNLHPDDLAEAERVFAETVDDGAVYASSFRICLPSGELRHVRSIGSIYFDASGAKKIVGVNWNITDDVLRQQQLEEAQRQSEIKNVELERARRQMEFNSLHDALTGLPNRRYLDQMLADEGAVSGDAPLSILHVDLDRFKDINDTLGHAAGDEILRHAASVLTRNTAEDDFVARIGGDEFVIVSRVPGGQPVFASLAATIIAEMNMPVQFEGHECRAGTSLGIACGEIGERPEQLLINADIALYEAKRRGRNRFEFFTRALRSQVMNTKQTADEILRGLERNEFLAWYQPQFDAHTLEITGVEALVRWEHPTKGLLTPDSFLKIAESLNVVDKIDGLVLNQALLHYHQWRAAGLDIPSVSVNISAQRLLDQALIAELGTLAIPKGALRFELLESISFDDHDECFAEVIREINALGIDIEIDDFGTGHASIINLLRLTPRRLKIDRQLIRPILVSQTERQLVSSIIDIGKACGIEILAEGVETHDHARLLADLGCDALQGYAFARPMAPAAIPGFVRARAWKGEADAVGARSRKA